MGKKKKTKNKKPESKNISLAPLNLNEALSGIFKIADQRISKKKKD